MEEQSSAKKILIIAGVILLLLIIVVVGYLLLRGGNNSPEKPNAFSALFGNLGNSSERIFDKITGADAPSSGAIIDANGNVVEPLFKQLSVIQVAGATSVEKGGKTVVRYVARENGYVYDVDPKTGITTQLTKTVIPRIYEAYFAQGGNSVVLRYLKHDDLAQKDIIKTYIANLVLPITSASSAPALGTLSGSDEQMPDNILSVSISPDGTKLFYLLPVEDGVSGTVVNMTSRIATEIFRNSFSEWIPQLLNSGNVILTSKASANIAGYSYLYDANKKTLSRLVREKNGLTTLATKDGDRILYSENLLGNTILGLYDEKGFGGEEGVTVYTAPLQLATLPEKCVWSENLVRAYCAGFASTPHAQIPDEWYQGALSFSDTFWTINTTLADLVFLADPQKDESAKKMFDVIAPFIDKGENHFYFIDKNDSTLWSMRLEKSKYTTSDEIIIPTNTEIPLSPEEMRDAVGSTVSTGTKLRK